MDKTSESSSSDHNSVLIFKPLMISMVGILITALAIVGYQFVLTKYCRNRQQAAAATAATATVAGRQSQIIGTGVDKEILNSMPIISFSRNQGDDKNGYLVFDCSVCLGGLEEGEMIRLLPNCKHIFHVGCIDEWCISHSNCPICRSPIIRRENSYEGLSLKIVEVQEEEVNGVIEISHDDQNRVVNLNSRMGSGSKLRSCVSLVWPNSSDDDNDERKQKPLVLKRSLSMDSCYVSIEIQESLEIDSSSSSSSPQKLGAGNGENGC